MKQPGQPHLSTAVAALMVAGVVVLAAFYLASISSYWRISPDSATYVGFGKSLASGQGWNTAPPQPPVTSLLYAAVLYLFPDGYVALNALTKLLILMTLGLVFALLTRLSNRAQALLVVLLSLSSRSLYHASTQLLSEPHYMFASAAALWLLERPVTGASIRGAAAGRHERFASLRPWLAGVLLIVTAMTRTIGLALPLAVLLVNGRARFERGRNVETVHIVCALLAFLVVAVWELYAMGGSYVGGWIATPFVDDPFSPDPDGPPAAALVAKLHDNIRLLPAVGGVLLNSWSPGHGLLGFALRCVGTLLFVLGLLVALRRRMTVTPVYVLLFVLVATAHMLVTGERDHYRFLVPVIPFVFHYTIEGIRHLAAYAARAAQRNWVAISLQAAGAVCVTWSVSLGITAATRGLREAHSSPFGSYPIKRPENYDAQTVALWLKGHSQPQERYASAQRDMFDVLTERRGSDIVPGRTRDNDAFMAWLDEERARYVLVDHKNLAVRDSLFAAIRANPDRLHPLVELPHASLYEVRPSKKW